MQYEPSINIDETYYIVFGVNMSRDIDFIGRPMDVILAWRLRTLGDGRITKARRNEIYYPAVF